MEKKHYICIPVIEQCKYKLKKRKIVNYIDDEIIDEDSDSVINDVIDSYVEVY